MTISEESESLMGPYTLTGPSARETLEAFDSFAPDTENALGSYHMTARSLHVTGTYSGWRNVLVGVNIFEPPSPKYTRESNPPCT
jgi:hypothetical protein